MGDILQDLRYALRTLWRAPGFTLVAGLTLALGIGANTAIFSIASALLLRPLPVESPEQLVRLHAAVRNAETSAVEYTTWSYPEYADHAAQTEVFAGLAAQHHWGVRLGADEPERVSGRAVTGNFFQVLGVAPLLGRTLLPEDDRADEAVRAAVISRSMWQQRFGGDPDVVGRTITLNGEPFTVVGVVGAEAVFRAIGDPELWIPVHTRAAMEPGMNPIDTRNVSFIPLVVGRLRPDVTIEQAQTAADLVTHRVAAADADASPHRHIALRPAGTLHGLAFGIERAATLRFAAMLLLGVVAVVLLIACTNVANLSLARAIARLQELGVRQALGAGRSRLVRQLLTESVLLAVLGAAAGLAVAHGALVLALRVPEVAELSPGIDLSVLGFTGVIALGASLVFGLMPALLGARHSLATTLRSGGRALTPRLGLQRALIAGQIGLALLLVIASGLVLRTLKNLMDVDLGFRTERLLVADVALPPAAATSPDAMHAAAQQLLDEVRALPGVRDVGLSSLVPLGRGSMTYTLEVPGYEPPPGENAMANITTVDDGYFRALGTPLVRGEGFEGRPAGELRGVLINEAMARRFWSGRDAVGQRFVVAGDTAQVIGVVADIRHESVSDEAVPMLFFRFPRMSWGFFNLHIRTETEPAALYAPVRQLIQANAPGRPAPNIRTMEELVGVSLLEARVTASFFTLFGALALLLAAVGLYGVMAYSVAQRTREIGIRIALGADLASVVRQVLRESATLVALGTAGGLVAAYLLTGLIRGVLYEIEPADPMTYGLAALLLLGVAVAAAYLPARRAARVDPMVALRAE
jgi:predicted permease